MQSDEERGCGFPRTQGFFKKSIILHGYSGVFFLSSPYAFFLLHSKH